jgi:HlyD family secretion protein
MLLSPKVRSVSLRSTVARLFLIAVSTSSLVGCGSGGTDGGATEPASDKVTALGRLEPRDGIVNATGTPGDRLDVLHVAAGQDVDQDEVLATFASRPLKKIEVRSIEAQLREAEARRQAEIELANARITRSELELQQAKQVKDDIAVLEKRVEVATANLQLAEKDLRRVTTLPDDLVSEQNRERYCLLRQKAELELAAAKAEHEKALRDSKFGISAGEASLSAAKATKTQTLTAVPIESLRAGLELAQEQLAGTQLLAPQEGTILQILVREGEMVGSLPILRLANLEQMVVVAEVHESDVKRVHLGQKARIESDAFRTPYDTQGLHGTVERIGRLISAPTLGGLSPSARIKRRVMEVRILIDPEDTPQAAEFVGMEVNVTFSD